MKKEDRRFIIILFIVSILTVIIAVLIQTFSNYFAISDFSNISSILQGTLGIAVSLAGAIVAIRLARIGTLIIEKEKQREDNKFYHDVINNSLGPIRKLTSCIQDFHFICKSYDYILLLKPEDLDSMDDKILEGELKKMKEDISQGLDNIICAINEITVNNYASAFWLSVADYRLKNNLLLLRGGGARSIDGDFGSGQGRDEYIIEDLNQLQYTLRLVLKNFLKCNLTKEDLGVAKYVLNEGFYKPYGGFIFSGSFLIGISLISLYYNIPYRYLRVKNKYNNYKHEFFENKFLLLLIDIFHNLPTKTDLLRFSNSIFPLSDENIIRESPVAKTFDILNKSFWFSFMVTFDLERLKIEELKLKKYGRIFTNEKCDSAWYKWQLNKIELDDKNILNIIKND